jgi:hypothetical protein
MKMFLATTGCELMIERIEAGRSISDVDARDHVERVERLIELSDLLTGDTQVGFSGQAAEWLFEDVKATWIYGCFVGTVLTAHAFSLLQVSGQIRLVSDDPNLAEEAFSLEHLGELAVAAGAIDIELQTQLLRLHDLHRLYTAARLREHLPALEVHLDESETVSQDPPLLVDARFALMTAARVLYRHS